MGNLCEAVQVGEVMKEEKEGDGAGERLTVLTNLVFHVVQRPLPSEE